MIVVHSEEHRRHAPAAELHGGRLGEPFERPERVDLVLEALGDHGLDDIRPPDPYGPGPVTRVHDPAYLEFLATAWSDWVDAGYEGDLVPNSWPVPGSSAKEPDDVRGRLGRHALAADSPITEGTWAAVRSSCAVAQTAQRVVADGARAAFGLCRPSGHHATRDRLGGYCFLNNAAVAAQQFVDAGVGPVAVLDVDFHHGNGTQDVFYDRPEVRTASLHGDPRTSFPYYWGHADELGAGPGRGANRNWPLPAGTTGPAWLAALDDALEWSASGGTGALVVALGVDTAAGDPLGSFGLLADDFEALGARLAVLGLPTVLVMEGGYATADLGVHTARVLTGFDRAVD